MLVAARVYLSVAAFAMMQAQLSSPPHFCLMSCLPCLERRVLNIWNLCRLIHGTGFISMMDLSLITAHH